jgi:beta-glucosidase
LQLDRSTVTADGTVRASLLVKNVGSRAADEVVQLYVSALDSKQPRARKDLRGIERISLAAGESRRVEFAIRPAADLQRYDVAAAKYVVDPGRYEVQIGASSADIRQHARFSVTRGT